MPSSIIASLEDAQGALPATATAEPSAAYGVAVLPGAAQESSALIPLVIAVLFLAVWGGFGAGYALLAPVAPPLGLAIAYTTAGLACSVTLAMAVHRHLRRRMAALMHAASTAQRAFLQDALDQLAYGLSIWDSDDRMVMWNRRFGELMPRATAKLRRDMPYDELLQVWIDCGYAPDNAGAEWLQSRLERRWLGAGSDYRSIDEREFAFIEQTGDNGVTALTVRDITETRSRERALKDSEERYSLALIASNEALWDCDLRNDRAYLSPRALAIIEVDDPATPTRQTWLSHIHPDDRDRQQQAWDDHMSGRADTYSIEYRVVGADGNVRWVYDRGLALRDSTGAPYRVAGSLGDISERKQAERELTDARDTAELANRARTEFLSNITHEFKTPLNIVIGFSEMLAKPDSQQTDTDRLTYAQEIHQAGTRLDRLVSDLLDMARAGSAETALADSQLDLGVCLNRAADLVSHRAAARRIALEISTGSGPLRVIGDLGKLKHALFNLLDYTIAQADPATAIGVRGLREPGQGILIQIDYQASGIVASKLRDALQPLTSETASGMKRSDGVDLALAVAETFVNLHGGALQLSLVDNDRVMAEMRLPEERAI
tara:strand:+ start:185 stop:2002 length:1818 start_codon:yes stop_codon:yes gene_type:complete